MTEEVLVARAQAGDMDAFEELVMTYADRLFAVLLRMLGDRTEAEDVAQEVEIGRASCRERVLRLV